MSVKKTDMKTFKRNATSASTWIRILYMLLFYIAGSIGITLLVLIVAIQTVMNLVTGAINPKLQEFTGGLNRYLHQVADYLTFNSEEKPFPFSDWPAAASTPAKKARKAESQDH